MKEAFARNKEAVHEGNRIVGLSAWGGIDEQSSAFKALSPIQQSRCDDAHVVYNVLFVNGVLVHLKSRRVDMDKPTDASRKQPISKSGYDNRLLPRCRMSGYEMVRDNQHNVIAYRRISPAPDKYIDYTHVSGLSQTMPASLGTVEHNEKLIKNGTALVVTNACYPNQLIAKLPQSKRLPKNY